MKRILFVITLLAAQCHLLAQLQVAMLEPVVVTGEVKVIEISMLRGEMTKAIASQKGFAAFTRTDIDQIMKEHNFQQSGMVDDATRKRIGEMQGVDYVCVTKVSKEGQNFYLEACLVHIETGKISQPATAYGELSNGSFANMLSKCTDLAKELTNIVVPKTEKEIVEDNEPVFVVVETMPVFPGGAAAMMKFISENIQYPETAKENGIQGRAICQCVINKDGSITDVVVTRSTGDTSLDEEAIRVIESMPKWTPGMQRGQAVRVKYTLPINFRL